MRKTGEILIKDYIDFATIKGETKLSGDYETGNKMGKKLYEIFTILKQDKLLAEYVITSIFGSNSIRAKSLAAVDALRLGILVDQTILILEEVSYIRQDIIGFGCKMALKIYRGEISGKSL